MKVVFLTLNYWPSEGGLQRHVAGLAESLVRDGNEVEIWTTRALERPSMPRAATTDRPDEMRNGVLIRRFHYADWPVRALRHARVGAARLGLPWPAAVELLGRGPIAPGLAAALRRNDADVICAAPVGFLLPYYLLLTRSRQGRVLLGALHPSAAVSLRMAAGLADRCDVYVASTKMETLTMVAAGAHRCDFEVIPPGVAMPTSPSRPARLGRDDGATAPVIGFLGRQASYKGIDTLLDAMRRVWAAEPSARLVIAGSVTDYSAALRSMVALLPPAQRAQVTVLDDFDDDERADILDSFTMLVNVSSEESYGLVFLEAWIAGVPVIGPDDGAPAEVIDDGVTGLTCPVGDADRLAALILELIADPALRDRLAEAGWRRTVAQNDWSMVSASWGEALAAASRRAGQRAGRTGRGRMSGAIGSRGRPAIRA